jgi:hypothetical protein
MKISEDRFKSILAGTATNLTSNEILLRREAFDAERRGEDPLLAVEARMFDVTIVRAEAPAAIPPPDVPLKNAQKKGVTSPDHPLPPRREPATGSAMMGGFEANSNYPGATKLRSSKLDGWLAKSHNWNFEGGFTIWAIVISALALFAPVIAVPLLGIAGFAMGCLILIGLGIGLIQGVRAAIRAVVLWAMRSD